MQKLTLTDYKKMPWKNGQGVTFEIARDQGDTLDDFGYRISMADVASDGAFSLFKNKARLLSVIDGAGIHLTIDKDDEMTVKTFDVIVFDGSSDVDSTLLDGAIRDLNVIYDPQLFDANLQWLARPQTVNSRADKLWVLGLENDTTISLADQMLMLQRFESAMMANTDIAKNPTPFRFNISKPCMLIEIVKKEFN